MEDQLLAPPDEQAKPTLKPEDYLKPTTKKAKATPYKRQRAEPEDDPEPLGRESVDIEGFLETIARCMKAGDWSGAELKGMTYAYKAVKAEGLMLDPDDPLRDSRYRYFQVNRFNWQETLERLGYPVPEDMPSALAIDTGTVPGTTKRQDGPSFIVHDETAKETKKEGTFVVATLDEQKRKEIEKRRAALPPR